MREVISHPQALAQSTAWLDEHTPGSARTACASTALAVKQLAESAAGAVAGAARRAAGTAAVGAAIAGEVYRVPLLRRGIQNGAGNSTRFVVIAPAAHANATAPPSVGPLRCGAAIALRLPALPVVLDALQRAGLDIIMLVSRPAPGIAWGAQFYVEMRLAEGCPIARAKEMLEREIGNDLCTLTWMGCWFELDNNENDGSAAGGMKRKR